MTLGQDSNAEHVVQLLEDIVSHSQMSEEKKKELFDSLIGAITLSFVNRATDGLPDADKEILRSKKFDGIQEAMDFLVQSLSQDDLKKALAEAASETLDKFLKKLES